MMQFFLLALLLVLSGLFSGLNIALLSLDIQELKRKASLGNKDAKKVLPVREKGNLLLSTLLLGNVAVNAAISILSASYTTGLVGGIISTVLIVIIGEIIPQSFMSRHALKSGAKVIWVVKVAIFLLFPVTYPLAWALDKFIGKHVPTVWSREEIKAIISDHEDSPDSPIDADEEKIVHGALSFSRVSVKDAMTPRGKVFMLNANSILDQKLMSNILIKRHTRVPLYKGSKNNIIGIMFVKDLIGAELGIKLGDLAKNHLLYVKESSKLDACLNKFIKQKSHMAIVVDKNEEFAGIITLEDILEEILQSEVYDETDHLRS